MITFRRNDERHRSQRGRQTVWLTFYPRDRAGLLADSFGALESLSENRLPPSGNAPEHLHHDIEVVTFVREGVISYVDSAGFSGNIKAGEFQRMTATQAIRRNETNASATSWGHVFQIWLRTRRSALKPSYEQRRFSLAERRGALRVVASPDARKGSLHLHLDALIYSAVLDPGQHVVHELSPERSAWLHILHGELTAWGKVLTTGDGVGITAERVVSLTARKETEIMLIDLQQPPAGGWDRRTLKDRNPL